MNTTMKKRLLALATAAAVVVSSAIITFAAAEPEAPGTGSTDVTALKNYFNISSESFRSPNGNPALAATPVPTATITAYIGQAAAAGFAVGTETSYTLLKATGNQIAPHYFYRANAGTTLGKWVDISLDKNKFGAGNSYTFDLSKIIGGKDMTLQFVSSVIDLSKDIKLTKSVKYAIPAAELDSYSVYISKRENAPKFTTLPATETSGVGYGAFKLNSGGSSAVSILTLGSAANLEVQAASEHKDKWSTFGDYSRYIGVVGGNTPVVYVQAGAVDLNIRVIPSGAGTQAAPFKPAPKPAVLKIKAAPKAPTVKVTYDKLQYLNQFAAIAWKDGLELSLDGNNWIGSGYSADGKFKPMSEWVDSAGKSLKSIPLSSSSTSLSSGTDVNLNITDIQYIRGIYVRTAPTTAQGASAATFLPILPPDNIYTDSFEHYITLKDNKIKAAAGSPPLEYFDTSNKDATKHAWKTGVPAWKFGDNGTDISFKMRVGATTAFTAATKTFLIDISKTGAFKVDGVSKLPQGQMTLIYATPLSLPSPPADLIWSTVSHDNYFYVYFNENLGATPAVNLSKISVGTVHLEDSGSVTNLATATVVKSASNGHDAIKISFGPGVPVGSSGAGVAPAVNLTLSGGAVIVKDGANLNYESPPVTITFSIPTSQADVATIHGDIPAAPPT
ncbi:MAG: hypothetical protein LBN40_05470 [Oscillospiraceae bacterium]|nr:hypothetical protein [Oscillospiraceae bacterium]